MKVIFLDMDGVLNSDEYWERVKNTKIPYLDKEVDPSKMQLLKNAINQTGAKLVLSSSWRTMEGEVPDYLTKYFEKYGIELRESTPRSTDWR